MSYKASDCGGQVQFGLVGAAKAEDGGAEQEICGLAALGYFSRRTGRREKRADRAECAVRMPQRFFGKNSTRKN